MKILIFTGILFAVCLPAENRKCKSGYHFWRPYNGTLPRDAFIAGVDEDGKKNLVARVVVPDANNYGLSVIPTQLKEYSDHVHVAWNNVNTFLVYDYIEVLCSENPKNLDWVTVLHHVEDVQGECCLVQGGKGFYNRENQNFHIGKAVFNEDIVIGRVSSGIQTVGVEVMHHSELKRIENNFQVLTYDCDIIPTPTTTEHIDIDIFWPTTDSIELDSFTN